MKEERQSQFLDEVFPAELEEIRGRRDTVGLDTTGLEGPTSVDIGLVGLAFSGGGIRSSTFCLGVIEALANAGLLKRADYLSTVSGGGYIGSCLSSLLNDPDTEPQGRKFPFHLRNASNYLGSRVNVSDGGHLENLAIYELLRRRCSYIVSVDGGADPTHRFGDLVELIRFAKIDMRIKIEIDLSDLEKDGNGFSRKHWALGTIRYGGNQTGQLLYIKASLTGDENLYVRDYAEQNPLFPHQSTANQFFTETQFEACRALGYHAASRAIAEHRPLAKAVEQQPEVAESA